MFYAPKIITIIGPTATGKSNLAIKIAKNVNGEIINADSRLFYKGMDIGTSKPQKKDMKEVKHHLIDIASPSVGYNLYSYLENSNQQIKEIFKRGKIPIIVGGTGQYIWALIEGWQLQKTPINQRLRNQLEKLDLLELQNLYKIELASISNKISRKIDIQNKRRLIRFIEINREDNSEIQFNKPPKWNNLIIGLHLQRKILHKKIIIRINQMLKEGLLNETKNLFNLNLPKKSPFYSCIGYRELIPYIKQDIIFDKAIKNTIISTNRLVRHQYNWFKLEDARINWFDCSKNFTITQEKIMYQSVRFINR